MSNHTVPSYVARAVPMRTRANPNPSQKSVLFFKFSSCVFLDELCEPKGFGARYCIAGRKGIAAHDDNL